MVFCLQAYLQFASTATRDARLAQARSFIENKPRFGPTQITPIGETDLLIETRFESQSDLTQASLATRNLAGALPGSTVRIHACPHDENKGRCPDPEVTVL